MNAACSKDREEPAVSLKADGHGDAKLHAETLNGSGWHAAGGDAGIEGSLCEIRMSGGLFGIETRIVREVLGARSMHHVPLAPGFIAGMVSFHGEIVAVVSLAHLLGLPPLEGACCVLVLDGAGGWKDGSAPFGLAVEDVGGVVTELERCDRQPVPAAKREICRAVYRMDGGLMYELDPELLKPGRLLRQGRDERANRSAD